MFRPDSLTLGAYVDGELDSATAADVEAAAAQDPTVRHELDRLLRLTATLRVAYDDPMNEPVPDHLISAILNHSNPANENTVNTGAKVVALPRRTPRTAPRFAWAAAAAVALVVGFGSAQLLDDAAEPSAGPSGSAAYQAALQDTINQALERLPNGQQAPLAVNSEPVGSVTPLRTYINADGRYCRDYVVSLGVTAGRKTACRTDDGLWKEPLLRDGSFGKI